MASFLHILQAGHTRRRDAQDLRATVDGVGLDGDETVLGQTVDHIRDSAWGDVQNLSQTSRAEIPIADDSQSPRLVRGEGPLTALPANPPGNLQHQFTQVGAPLGFVGAHGGNNISFNAVTIW